MDWKTWLYGAGGATALAWILGKFNKSQAYIGFRNTVGTAAARAGELLSKLGNTRLGGLWEPLEFTLTDWILFSLEQFMVGLRKDNPAKIQAQIERLEGVGSETRVEALRKSLEAAQ